MTKTQNFHHLLEVGSTPPCNISFNFLSTICTAGEGVKEVQKSTAGLDGETLSVFQIGMFAKSQDTLYAGEQSSPFHFNPRYNLGRYILLHQKTLGQEVTKNKSRDIVTEQNQINQNLSEE